MKNILNYKFGFYLLIIILIGVFVIDSIEEDYDDDEITKAQVKETISNFFSSIEIGSELDTYDYITEDFQLVELGGPYTLAENAGQDALGRLLELTAAQTSADSDWLGLDLESESISDMHEAGIREPIAVTRQAIKGATDSAVSVLRIDDLLWAKQDPQIPEGVMEQLEGMGGA